MQLHQFEHNGLQYSVESVESYQEYLQFLKLCSPLRFYAPKAQHWGNVTEKEYKEDKKSFLFSETIYGYSHGGMTVSLAPYGCPFDSGVLGVCYVSKRSLRDYSNMKRLSQKRIEQYKPLYADMLKKDFGKYKRFIEGSLYNIIVTDEDGESLFHEFVELDDYTDEEEILKYCNDL